MNAAQNTASVMLVAGNALLNNGTLIIYSGTMPATPETAISGNTALVTFTFSATAFAAPTFSTPNMQAVASFVSSTIAGTSVTTGTAAWARALKSDGTTVVADFTVGTTGTDITIGSTSLTNGVSVAISSFTLKLPAV